MQHPTVYADEHNQAIARAAELRHQIAVAASLHISSSAPTGCMWYVVDHEFVAGSLGEASVMRVHLLRYDDTSNDGRSFDIPLDTIEVFDAEVSRMFRCLTDV